MLVSFQALEKNAYHLEALAPILEAPFRGRQDKHAGVVEAFSDFWQETFASMPEPSSGWPEQIVRCLEVVAREQEDEASVENLTALDEDCASPCFEPAAQQELATGEDSEKSFDSDDEGSVELPSPGTLSRLSAAPLLRPAVFPRFSSPEPSLPLAPSTPKSSPRTQRPHASLRSVRSIEDAIFITASPASSPIRAPTTPKRSPAKADGTGSARSQASRDKENMSPSLRIATVTERLAMRSPLLLESILGKRPRGDEFDDADLAEKAYKKGRLDASLLAPPPAFSNAVQVHMVMHDASNVPRESTSERPAASSASTEDKPVFEEDESSSSDSEEISVVQPVASGSRKRKGSFLDAVVVPSVAEVLRAKRRFSADLRGSSLSLDSGTPASEPKSPALRRTRSATKLLGKEAEFQRLPYTPKKRRMGRAHQLREEAASEPMSSPSRSLQDAQLFGSGECLKTGITCATVADIFMPNRRLYHACLT